MLRQSGEWALAGTTRDFDKRSFLIRHGIKSYLFDNASPLGDPQLFLHGVTHILVSIPPDDDGDPVFRMHGNDIIRLLPSLRWIGYLSSTNVYGDREGGWVDESSELRPTSKRGSRRARAEEQWLSLSRTHGLPVHIFRLAGIYGPGRSAIDSVRAGLARRIDKPGHAFSRVHVEDIALTLLASMTKPSPGAVYNVCDDVPAPSHELINLACELLDVSPPPLIPFEQADLAPMTRSFYCDNKRIRNDRIKRELGVVLRHPDYKSGLKACLEADRQMRPFVTAPEGENVA